MYELMPVVFLAGIVLIAFEEKIHINKAAVALLMALTLWTIFGLQPAAILGSHPNAGFLDFLSKNPALLQQSVAHQYHSFIVEEAILKHVGDISQTLFFIMCTMIVIELIDSHGGFRAVSVYVKTRNKRALLWVTAIFTFVMAPLVNNMACAIIVVSLLRKLLPAHRTDRLVFASMAIIAANAGGSFSPIGDVTTILLWTGGNITALHQISHLFLPGLVTMLVPLTLLTFHYKKGEAWSTASRLEEENTHLPQLSRADRRVILLIGVLSLSLVPLFRFITGLPPFMGVMTGLVLLWIYTDMAYRRIDYIEDQQKLKVAKMTSMIDMPTILFFFGILMSVAALQSAGQLSDFSRYIDAKVDNPYLVAFLLGTFSAVLDNVALVAGAMGMYPVVEAHASLAPHLQNYTADGQFWTFVAYCAVNGGSLLIIGSATGIAVMGMEKITFAYYLKRFSWLALLGYLAGAATYYFICR